MILDETYTLSNGVKIPKLGLGTWFIDDQDVALAVNEAVNIGYRHFDTAQAYGNERGVGEGIATCGVARADLFVTSKLAAEIKDYAGATRAIDETLNKMGLDYLDLMLIHSPQPWQDFRGQEPFYEGNLEAWCALEDAYRAGKVRAIGVSNFLQSDLENLIENGDIMPMVDQLLVHAGNTPFELLDNCQKQDILVEAYSPIAHGKAFEDKTIEQLATKYNVSIPQLCIRYALQLGTVPLPKTADPKHMADNAKVDFVISKADMDTLKHLKALDYGDSSEFPVFSAKNQAKN